MKAFPTVVASRDGERVLRIVEFQGVDHVPNRDAVAYYFSSTDLNGDRIRFGVMFSGTVLAVGAEAFGLPVIPDRETRLVTFALAAVGDYLDDGAVLEPTPPSTPAHWIECFSPHFQSWADREAADDASLERYLRVHLFEAWRADQGTWEMSLSDLLRLGRPMASAIRVLELGDGDLWEIVDRADDVVRLKPSKQLIRAAQGGDKAASLPSSSEPTKETEPVDVPNEPPSFVYVDESRLADLRRLESSEYDLRKVIALCEELNICYRSQCYHAVAALTRALLDHIPPIFGFDTFVKVANNYAAGRSLKACLERLQGSARDIADTHLHQVIRRTESLPTRTQVNFSNDLDMLLAESIRTLEDGGRSSGT